MSEMKYYVDPSGAYLGGFGAITTVVAVPSKRTVPKPLPVLAPVLDEAGEEKKIPVLDDTGAEVIDEAGAVVLQTERAWALSEVLVEEDYDDMQEVVITPDVPENAVLVDTAPDHASDVLVGFKVVNGAAVGGSWDKSKRPPAPISRDRRFADALVKAGVISQKAADDLLAELE